MTFDMKNLGSGMDGILKMVLGILAISGILIMVVSTLDMDGSDNPSSPNNIATATPKPTAVPTPATPGQSSMSAASAVPASPQGQTTYTDGIAASGQEFGSPMMDPSPTTIGGNAAPQVAPQAAQPPTNTPSPQPSGASASSPQEDQSSQPQI